MRYLEYVLLSYFTFGSLIDWIYINHSISCEIILYTKLFFVVDVVVL